MKIKIIKCIKKNGVFKISNVITTRGELSDEYYDKIHNPETSINSLWNTYSYFKERLDCGGWFESSSSKKRNKYPTFYFDPKKLHIASTDIEKVGTEMMKTPEYRRIMREEKLKRINEKI